MKILVTGSNGFLGKNLIDQLRIHGYDFLTFDQDNTFAELEDSIQHADLIIHLAGVNRTENANDFQSVNVNLTVFIVNKLIQIKKNTPIFFASSIQVGLDNPYGKSKKEAEDILMNYAKNSQALVLIYRLPNLFGKWSRPFYNSVVATFCHQLTHNQSIEIHDVSKQIPLYYIDDFIKRLHQDIIHLNTLKSTLVEINDFELISLGDLAQKLTTFKNIRETHKLVNHPTSFDQKLHATFMSYYDPHQLSYTTTHHRDQRGFLVELIKQQGFGQIFVSKTKPGVTRGNHYHHSKIEKFIVIEGNASIKFRKIDSNEVIEYIVSGDEIEIVDIIPGYTHSITNIGDKELITLFWSNQLFDPNDTDTYFMEV
jgi:UDP-2-acetamido-2,6-beta-L-arabino-hexul-4-ose reductase